jgi:hypothetical protein
VGQEAARDTAGNGGAADDGHGRHRRHGEGGLGFLQILCCAPRG